jgi:hypothetical protein
MPLSVPSVGEHRDEIPENEQWQNQAGGLPGARKYKGEQGDREDAEPAEGGLRQARHQRAEYGTDPLQGIQSHHARGAPRSSIAGGATVSAGEANRRMTSR